EGGRDVTTVVASSAPRRVTSHMTSGGITRSVCDGNRSSQVRGLMSGRYVFTSDCESLLGGGLSTIHHFSARTRDFAARNALFDFSWQHTIDIWTGRGSSLPRSHFFRRAYSIPARPAPGRDRWIVVTCFNSIPFEDFSTMRTGESQLVKRGARS